MTFCRLQMRLLFAYPCPLLEADDYRVIRKSLWQFVEYASAMTSGNRAVNPQLVTLPELTVPVETTSQGGNAAQPTPEGVDTVLGQMTVDTRH